MNSQAQLKTLKLSGMLDNLELRILEAQQNQLSYSEFLSLLLNDEIETRDMRKLTRLIRQAGLGTEKTLETFDFSFNPSLNAAHIRELATCRFIERGEGVFLIGPTGTGKTHLAKALCHQACRRHFTVAFYNFHHFFNKLDKATFSETPRLVGGKDQLSKLMKHLIFGFKKISQQSAEYLYEIVDSRYSVKSIILTSNRALNDWPGIFPDPVIANAILDRLAHNSHQLIIKGESYRKKFKPSFQNA